MQSTIVSLRVRYFAQARALAGTGEERVELPAPAHVGELVSRVMQVHPQLSEVKPILHVMVNGRMAEEGVELHEGDSVVVLPPTAGG